MTTPRGPGTKMEDLKHQPSPRNLYYEIPPDAPDMQEFYGAVFILNHIEHSQGRLAPYSLPDWLKYTSRGVINWIPTRFFPMPTGKGIGFIIADTVFTLKTVPDDATEDELLRWREVCDLLHRRNIEDGIQYPDREFQIAEEQREREKVEAKLEATERALRAKELEEAQKVKEAAKLENLLDLPQMETYPPKFLSAWLLEAGIDIGERAIQKQLKRKIRDEDEAPRQGSPYQPSREEAQDILSYYWQQAHKKKK